MKRILLGLGLAALILLAVMGCMLFAGDDGKAYVTITYDANTNYGYTVDGGWLDATWWPDAAQSSVELTGDFSPGEYTGKYVLYDFLLADPDSDGYYEYCVKYNDTYLWDGYYGSFTYSNYDYATALSYYTQSDFDLYANDISFTITVERGTYFFKDGEDRHFTVNLPWDPGTFDETPQYTSIVGSASGAKAKVLESSPDKLVQEITDGPYTLRVEIKKHTSPTPSAQKPPLPADAKDN
jgi:hypothetical protein